MSDTPWSNRTATEKIREMAQSRKLGLIYKIHATERLQERGLIMSDVLFVLKNGFVHDEPEPSTREGFFKYCIESRSPNSGGRELRVVVIPDLTACKLKIVTVMWVDEVATKAGTIARNET